MVGGKRELLHAQRSGRSPRVYPELVTSRLARAVSKQHEDVLLIGGSPAMGVTPPQLRRAFHAGSGFNLAYSLLGPRDLVVISSAAVSAPGLKRLLVELPFTLMEWDRPPAATGAGAVAVLSASWYALPDFGEDIARGSLERAFSGAFQTPEWRREASEFLGTESVGENKSLLRQADDAFARVPAATFEAITPTPCGEFPVITRAIAPLIAASAKRGIELDLYFPPTPPEAYPRAELKYSDAYANLFKQIMGFHGASS